MQGWMPSRLHRARKSPSWHSLAEGDLFENPAHFPAALEKSQSRFRIISAPGYTRCG
jgi:hypothetical protein